MKKRFIKFVSSILVLAFLLSAFSVLSFASTASAEESGDAAVTEDGIELIINRPFDEGWSYINGFGNNRLGDHKYTVDYEEDEEYNYNYFCRLDSVGTATGYLELTYGDLVPEFTHTTFEVDIKTDDLCNFGTPIIYMTSADNEKAKFNLAGITDNELVLAPMGDLTDSTKPSYTVGSLENGWLHFAITARVDQRICPECRTLYDLTIDNKTKLECPCTVDPEDPDSYPVLVSAMEKVMNARIYFGYTDTFDVSAAVKAPGRTDKIDLENNTYYYDVTYSGIAGISSFCIGIPANSKTTGHSYCIDNVKLYNNAEKPTSIPAYLGYGANVDVTMAKTEEIIGSQHGKTTVQYLNEGLIMKTGFSYCVDAGQKRAILTEGGVAYGAPVKMGGEVYVPLQAILDWIGYPLYQHDDGVSFDISTDKGSTFITVGRKTATVNGELVELDAAPGIAKDTESGLQYIVISKDDVAKIFAGYYVTYDDMGLIAISEGENLFNRESDLTLMLDVMKNLLYTKLSSQQYYNFAKENTNNFAHPYLFADQAQFDALYNTYANSDDADLKAYLEDVIADANAAFDKYTNPPAADEEDENYVPPVKNDMYEYLFDTVKNPYVELGNNGYDGGGRSPFLLEVTEDIKLLAFAYQITKDVKYSVLAYEIFGCISLWNHWAPAYFLDCSEAAANVAIAYDWLYNVWSTSYDIDEIEAAIYKNGLLIGYNYTNGVELNESILSNQGIYSMYNTATDSWNIIGTSNIAITALALLGTDYLNNGFVYNENATDVEMQDKNTTELGYVKAALSVLSANIYNVTQIGLDMYAPDGSFIESATKWSDATESLMLLSWLLDNTIGDDLGLSNTWALDKTFYFAYQVEYKVTDGYKYWNYHEAIGDYISTSLAYYAAKVLGDMNIAAIRTEQIGFKPTTVWDILAYDPAYVSAEIDKSGAEFALDYTLESCDAVISRSDWSENSLYIGVMANNNNVTGGQLDAGNFVYANKGYTWFADLGAETHTVYGYSDVAYRYGYYRHTAEGANTVIITTRVNEQVMPFGQATDGTSYISDYYNSEYGMYTIVNNSSLYLDKVTSAKRGVLLTNDRRTVVIQDEVIFKDTEECAWVSQITCDEINFFDDGRRAILRHRTQDGIVSVRATLIDPTGLLKFEERSAYDPLLSTVYKKNDSQKGGAMYTAEIDRSGLKKLVVKQSLASSFVIAVVIELVGSNNDPVEYEYKAIDTWGPHMITDKFVAEEVNTDMFTTPSVDDVVVYSDEAESYINSGSAFYALNISNFFRALSRVYNCEFWLGVEDGIYKETEAKKAYMFKYSVYRDRYTAFQKEVSSYITDTKKIAANMCGYEK
ncbi:MAG: hypothetical protein E7673_00010 [Ruminococcaceae bacterium]|nr:hypothetical protein [Oscillospiraceae bacterium]